MPFLEPLLAAAVLAGAILGLLAAGLAGYRVATRRAAPQRAALQIISELTPESLKQKAPTIADKLARAALTRLWALTEPVMTWETVPTETPATSATFLMLGIPSPSYNFFRRMLRTSIFMGGPLCT